MVPKSGSKLPFSSLALSERQLAAQIGAALQEELGASRRATKTVMGWTGVSDHTARSWLHGKTAPSGLHLVELATHSDPVMLALLRLTGHGNLHLGLNLQEIELRMERALAEIRLMNGGPS
jgi:hypothetical protein